MQRGVGCDLVRTGVGMASDACYTSLQDYVYNVLLQTVALV